MKKLKVTVFLHRKRQGSAGKEGLFVPLRFGKRCNCNAQSIPLILGLGRCKICQACSMTLKLSRTMDSSKRRATGGWTIR